MFTGIVQGTAKLVSIDEKPNFRTHVVELPDHMLDGLETGASVAHNGCCLTVTEINGNHVSFDLMKETLRITNLGDLKVGDWVNVERAAKFSSGRWCSLAESKTAFESLARGYSIAPAPGAISDQASVPG